MKGISAVIATILLLMITIAIASTAYMYVTGMIGGKTAKSIAVQHAACDSNRDISIVVKNTGTGSIVNSAGSGDLKILINNGDNTTHFDLNGVGGTTSYTIASQGNVMLVGDNGGTHYSTGANTILVISPSNSISQVVYC